MSIPVITSPLTWHFPINRSVLYRITATQFPDSYGTTGLPLNLLLDAATGRITGTIPVVGVFNVTIKATNVDGTGSATLVITTTDDGGVVPPPGPIAVNQAKYYLDPEELLEYADIDAVGQPIADFNAGVIGALQLSTTAIANKLGLIGGPGRSYQYVFPQAYTLPVQARFSVRIAQIDVPSTKLGDFVMMGELLDANGVYLGASLSGVRNAIFFGVVNLANLVNIYVWNGQLSVIPKGAKLNFRVFSYPSG